MLRSSNKNIPGHPGFRLVKMKFVKEVNAECFIFQHIKSGAQIFKIAADDPNKTFSVAFGTLPDSDAGTPHILEHSLLNGSKNFPVKSPFDVLSKGSLNTFLNAMTYPDFTIYPVASMNIRDYFNLMHVYCDAVFNPLIYDNPRIFMQEGWHYELTDIDAPLEYKGVVYNEMKGAFSSPNRELWYRIQKNLFPENGYRFSSGGVPSAIPTLTYDAFLDFHRKHYHPSNCFIYLYGDADLKEELAFLDKHYLAMYDLSESFTDIPDNTSFEEQKEIVGSYAMMEGSSLENQTFLSMNWVIGSGADQATIMALDILADVMVNQESAPLRKAVREAGIGKDIYATTQNMKQNMFSIVVQNANLDDKDRFKEVITRTLRELATHRLDPQSIDGAVNRTEFRLREGDDAQKGISYILRSMTGWLYSGDPIPALEYEPVLADLKKSLKNPYLEDIIKKGMLENPYGLLVALEPKAGLDKVNAEKISGELAAYRKSLSASEAGQILNTTRELIAYQQKEDSPEALASIPLLKLSDIDPKAPWYEAREQTMGGITQLHHEEFTNHIVYMNFWFDLRVLPYELLPFAALLSELLAKMDTAEYNYEQLDKLLNIHTGGFGTVLTSFMPGHKDKNLSPVFKIQMKATSEKLETAFGLLGSIIRGTNPEDKDRLYELLKRHQSQLESAMIQNGFSVAVTRLESYLTRRGIFNESIRGMNYYWFVNGLVKKFGQNPAEVISKLKKTQQLLFVKNNVVSGTTCSMDDFKKYSGHLETFVGLLPDRQVVYSDWQLAPAPLNEGILTSSGVQYVAKGYDFRQLMFPWDGKWNVLSHILSTDWLQTRIRVMGGAYGGFSSVSKNGIIFLASYRDPNLRETLENFDATGNYLTGFKADETSMARYIIGTIAGIDSPLTPSEKGEMAYRYFFEKTGHKELEADRQAVLATTAGDIRNMNDVLSKVLEKNVFCVYGSEEKLKDNRDLFGQLVVLQQ